MAAPGRANLARWPRRLEILALVLLAALPLVPYLGVIFAGVPRFRMAADLALEEYLTRHAWRGETLLGMPSRFHWAHPGPLFFYVNAPFVLLFGKASTGLYVGVAALVIAEIAFIVLPLRVMAGRAHALAAVVVVLLWFAAFGNVAANPWTRMTNTLPLVTFTVCAAIFALGNARAAIPAVFFGALATETHISTIPLVFIVLTGAVAVYAYRQRKRAWNDRGALGVAIGLGVLVSLPPLIQQVTADGQGNIRELAHFFAQRTEPYKSLHDTLVLFVDVSAWLPDRAFSGRLIEEGWLPFALRWDPIVIHLTPTAIVIGLIQLGAMIGAAVIAWRRRDHASLALLAFGVFAAATACYGIRGIIGEIHPSLVYWATAPSTVLWIGTLSAFFAAIEERVPAGWKTRRGIAAGVVPLVVVAIVITGEQSAWLKTAPLAPGAFPADSMTGIHELYEKLRVVEEREGFTPVVHLGWREWQWMHVLLLEHEKDGVDVRIGEDSRWAYPPTKSAAGAKNPRHIWVFAKDHEGDAPFTPCLDLIATVGDLSILAGDADWPVCQGR